MNKVWIIIPAAGVGKRMESNVPKQYLKLHGQTVIEHTLSCFTHHPDVAGIIVALHPNDPYWPDLSIVSSAPIHIVEGGAERSNSVLNALSFLNNQIASTSDYVLVHDAARPCLSKEDLDSLLDHRKSDAGQGAILAMPVRDTMKREQEGCIHHTVEREGLWHALTPQMFSMSALYNALDSALMGSKEVTDEASAMELSGMQPTLIEGDASNIKITRPADLYLAEFFLQQEAGEEKE
ncbi:MAG: 2-C-methyl-D-erythritol 4-phosphate cytidylyltransferase [Thiotrichaceae bacterium]